MIVSPEVKELRLSSKTTAPRRQKRRILPHIFSQFYLIMATTKRFFEKGEGEAPHTTQDDNGVVDLISQMIENFLTLTTNFLTLTTNITKLACDHRRLNESDLCFEHRYQQALHKIEAYKYRSNELVAKLRTAHKEIAELRHLLNSVDRRAEVPGSAETRPFTTANTNCAVVQEFVDLDTQRRGPDHEPEWVVRFHCILSDDSILEVSCPAPSKRGARARADAIKSDLIGANIDEVRRAITKWKREWPKIIYSTVPRKSSDVNQQPIRSSLHLGGFLPRQRPILHDDQLENRWGEDDSGWHAQKLLRAGDVELNPGPYEVKSPGLSIATTEFEDTWVKVCDVPQCASTGAGLIQLSVTDVSSNIAYRVYACCAVFPKEYVPIDPPITPASGLVIVPGALRVLAYYDAYMAMGNYDVNNPFPPPFHYERTYPVGRDWGGEDRAIWASCGLKDRALQDPYIRVVVQIPSPRLVAGSYLNFNGLFSCGDVELNPGPPNYNEYVAAKLKELLDVVESGVNPFERSCLFEVLADTLEDGDEGQSEPELDNIDWDRVENGSGDLNSLTREGWEKYVYRKGKGRKEKEVKRWAEGKHNPSKPGLGTVKDPVRKLGQQSVVMRENNQVAYSEKHGKYVPKKEIKTGDDFPVQGTSTHVNPAHLRQLEGLSMDEIIKLKAQRRLNAKNRIFRKFIENATLPSIMRWLESIYTAYHKKPPVKPDDSIIDRIYEACSMDDDRVTFLVACILTRKWCQYHRNMARNDDMLYMQSKDFEDLVKNCGGLGLSAASKESLLRLIHALNGNIQDGRSLQVRIARDDYNVLQGLVLNIGDHISVNRINSAILDIYHRGSPASRRRRFKRMGIHSWFSFCDGRPVRQSDIPLTMYLTPQKAYDYSLGVPTFIEVYRHRKWLGGSDNNSAIQISQTDSHPQPGLSPAGVGVIPPPDPGTGEGKRNALNSQRVVPDYIVPHHTKAKSFQAWIGEQSVASAQSINPVTYAGSVEGWNFSMLSYNIGAKSGNPLHLTSMTSYRNGPAESANVALFGGEVSVQCPYRWLDQSNAYERGRVSAPTVAASPFWILKISEGLTTNLPFITATWLTDGASSGVSSNIAGPTQILNAVKADVNTTIRGNFENVAYGFVINDILNNVSQNTFQNCSVARPLLQLTLYWIAMTATDQTGQSPWKWKGQGEVTADARFNGPPRSILLNQNTIQNNNFQSDDLGGSVPHFGYRGTDTGGTIEANIRRIGRFTIAQYYVSDPTGPSAIVVPRDFMVQTGNDIENSKRLALFLACLTTYPAVKISWTINQSWCNAPANDPGQNLEVWPNTFLTSIAGLDNIMLIFPTRAARRVTNVAEANQYAPFQPVFGPTATNRNVAGQVLTWSVNGAIVSYSITNFIYSWALTWTQLDFEWIWRLFRTYGADSDSLDNYIAEVAAMAFWRYTPRNVTGIGDSGTEYYNGLFGTTRLVDWILDVQFPVTSYGLYPTTDFRESPDHDHFVIPPFNDQAWCIYAIGNASTKKALGAVAPHWMVDKSWHGSSHMYARIFAGVDDVIRYQFSIGQSAIDELNTAVDFQRSVLWNTLWANGLAPSEGLGVKLREQVCVNLTGGLLFSTLNGLYNVLNSWIMPTRADRITPIYVTGAGTGPGQRASMVYTGYITQLLSDFTFWISFKSAPLSMSRWMAFDYDEGSPNELNVSKLLADVYAKKYITPSYDDIGGPRVGMPVTLDNWQLQLSSGQTRTLTDEELFLARIWLFVAIDRVEEPTAPTLRLGNARYDGGVLDYPQVTASHLTGLGPYISRNRLPRDRYFYPCAASLIGFDWSGVSTSVFSPIWYSSTLFFPMIGANNLLYRSVLSGLYRYANKRWIRSNTRAALPTVPGAPRHIGGYDPLSFLSKTTPDPGSTTTSSGGGRI